MIIDHEGNMIDAAFVHDNVKLFECFKVKVVRNAYNQVGEKIYTDLAGEEDYKEFPTNEQIMYCISKYQGDYATVEKIYTLEYVPFSEPTSIEEKDVYEDDIPW